MLCDEWEDGYLIYQLVVEGMEPAQVAAERGVSRATLVEQLRDAVDELAASRCGCPVCSACTARRRCAPLGPCR
jgi:hypothetical protein